MQKSTFIHLMQHFFFVLQVIVSRVVRICRVCHVSYYKINN